MLNIKAKVPTRVDLIGGTLDLWPIHQLLNHKGTINIGVGVYANVTLLESQNNKFYIKSVDQEIFVEGSFEEVSQSSDLPLIGMILDVFWDKKFPALNIELKAESPKGAGLGGSSALAICLAAALQKGMQLLDNNYSNILSDYDLVKKVQDVEAKLLFMPVGCQDYIGALRGGINYISYPPGGFKIETKTIDHLPELNKEMLLCYCGRSRFSGMNNWELFKKFCDRDLETVERFEVLGKIAEKSYEGFENNDWNLIRTLSKEDWEIRKNLCPGIETDETKAISELALQEGAYFSRVCGAGGGGVMAIFAPEEKCESIKLSVTKIGGEFLAAYADNSGLLIDCR